MKVEINLEAVLYFTFSISQVKKQEVMTMVSSM